MAATERRKLVNAEGKSVYVDSDASEAAWRAKGYHPEGAVPAAAPAPPPQKPTDSKTPGRKRS